MPKYQYTALDHKGDQKTGSLEANSEAEAMEAIRAHGLYPTQMLTPVLLRMDENEEYEMTSCRT